MRITSVQYSRVYSLGNYENEKIGVEVEVPEGDDPQAALAEARKFVDMSSKVFANNLEKAKHIVNNPDNFTVRQVRENEEFIKQYESTLKSLPVSTDLKINVDDEFPL